MTKFPLRQIFFLHCHRRRSMVRLIPLLKRVFFCPKIQRKVLGKPSPAYPRRPVYRTPCNPSVGAGFYPARSSALLVTDAGRCGHRPLRNPIGKHSVGADASVRPPGLYRISNNVSLRSQCAHWLWQSASPVPLAPLPKGGLARQSRDWGIPHLTAPLVTLS